MAQAGGGAVFDPANATFNGDPANSFAASSGGGYTSAAIPPGANGVAGVSYSGGVTYIDNQFEGGHAGQVGSINLFSVSGTGSGGLSASADMASIAYDFTLASTNGYANLDPVGITGFTLDLSVTTSVGPMSKSVTMSTGAGTYSGVVEFALDGADAGATLTGYTGSLTVNYELTATNYYEYSHATISVTVPADSSIDFDAVPEPSIWIILATGVIGTGFHLMRVRQRHARPVASA